MNNLGSTILCLLFVASVSTNVLAQQDIRLWDENITVRLQFEEGTTYYGHSEVFVCDSFPESEWCPPGDFDNKFTFPYLLDSLKVGRYSLIKYSKGLDSTYLLLQCDYPIQKTVSNLYVILNLPDSGYYFMDLESLKTNLDARERFQAYYQREISSGHLYEALDITPDNWEDCHLTKEEYNQRIEDVTEPKKKCFLPRRNN